MASDLPPSVPSVANVAVTIPMLPAVLFAKPFPDISKIEIFNEDNFKRW